MEGNINIDNTYNSALKSQQETEYVVSWNGLGKFLNLFIFDICI